MTEQEDEGAYLSQSLEALLLQYLLAGCPDSESRSLLQLQRLAQHPGPVPHHQRKLLGDVQQGLGQGQQQGLYSWSPSGVGVQGG